MRRWRYLADGSTARETQWIYEPGSFRPLAQVEGQSGNTQLHYIVTDLTGTARELCSEEGDVHWRGDQQLWGQHQETRTPMALRRFIGDAANDEIGCDLRYQGQLYDAESGLYYNRHRYYDPEIGQYISPDPIGLGGGLRPQGYVHNPVGYVDPLGLSGCPSNNEQGTISYRGDSRNPDTIFNEGFQTKGSSNDLLKHAADNNSPPSNFISTSKSPDVAAEFGSQFYTEEGYIYAMRSNNGIDVNATLGKATPFPNEMEIAIPGGVKPGSIMGATPVNADGSLGSYSILNPNYYGF